MRNEKLMKNNSEKDKSGEDMVRPEYDFTGGVRGKHADLYCKGHAVEIHKCDGTVTVQHFTPEVGAVLLDPDVRRYFPDSESVNKALRSLIDLIPRKRRSA
ncbi:MAG: hypothetical protein M1133_03370 [Armatimonadetes bacterium]|nr:hypothetical protein [Armatimonadota bacterium]